jgi:hypothetical protein
MNTPKKSEKILPVAKKRRKKPSEFHALRLKAGLADTAKAAELCGVTARTVQNWDAKGAPETAMRLLQLYDRKDCAGAGPGWSGFLFSRGVLVNTRLKLRFSPERLALWPSTCDKLARLEAAALEPRAPGDRTELLKIVLSELESIRERIEKAVF